MKKILLILLCIIVICSIFIGCTTLTEGLENWIGEILAKHEVGDFWIEIIQHKTITGTYKDVPTLYTLVKEEHRSEDIEDVEARGVKNLNSFARTALKSDQSVFIIGMNIQSKKWDKIKYAIASVPIYYLTVMSKETMEYLLEVGENQNMPKTLEEFINEHELIVKDILQVEINNL